MPSASFTLGATTVNFSRAPQYPPRSLDPLQAQAASAGGVRIVQEVYATDDLIDLSWTAMPDTEWQALLDFYLHYAIGQTNTFTYTDIFSVARTVRFVEPPDGAEKSWNAWRVKTQLRIA